MILVVLHRILHCCSIEFNIKYIFLVAFFVMLPQTMFMLNLCSECWKEVGKVKVTCLPNDYPCYVFMLTISD